MRSGALILLGLSLLLSQSLVARSAEISVIGSTGVASVVTELARQFEAKTGHSVQTDFAVIAVSRRKIDVGGTFDIAILGPVAIDELISQGKLIADTRTAFGRTGLGVAVRKGTSKPVISTTEAFKKTLLAAKSVGHSKEGLSGVAFLAILDRLGIATEMKPKLRTYESAAHTNAIATGEVELGVTGIGPILSMSEADFAGPLPAEIQSYVVFTAAVNATARDHGAARSFLQFMTSPAVVPVFKAKGMEQD
jgi:molybdate transport system substrate-binding protein